MDEKAELKYMVGFCSVNPIFGFEQYHNCIGTASYAEAMQEYAERIHLEAALSLEQQEKRGIYNTLTMEDCIPDSSGSDYEGQLIVIRANVLQRDKQTADYQLCRATGGFGCRATARGQSVYAVNIYDGRETRYDRADVLGIIRPECVPDWAKDRVMQMEQQKKKQEPER